MKLTDEQKKLFLETQKNLAGAQDAIQIAIREAAGIIGKGHQILGELWQQLAKEHNLVLADGKYKVEHQENGDLVIVETQAASGQPAPMITAATR